MIELVGFALCIIACGFAKGRRALPACIAGAYALIMLVNSSMGLAWAEWFQTHVIPSHETAAIQMFMFMAVTLGLIMVSGLLLKSRIYATFLLFPLTASFAIFHVIWHTDLGVNLVIIGAVQFICLAGDVLAGWLGSDNAISRAFDRYIGVGNGSSWGDYRFDGMEHAS